MVIWDLWIEDVGNTGISFARGGLDPTDRLWVHAAPVKLSVEVRDAAGSRLAYGSGLKRTEESPMALLEIDGDRITRKDAWPQAADMGTPVILPGGEVGRLQAWWNDPGHQEWRWSIELYNRR